MSILIKGMKMPKEGDWRTVRIYPDGTCAIPNWQGDCTLIKGVQAGYVPPHGRLIDADALIDALPSCTGDDEQISKHGAIRDFIILVEKAPTIVEAEGDDNG